MKKNNDYNEQRNSIMEESRRIVEQEVNRPLTEEEQMIANLPSNNPAPKICSNEKIPANESGTHDENKKAMIVNSIYNTDTGISTPTISDGEIDQDYIIDDNDIDVDNMIDYMINGSSVTTESLSKLLSKDKTYSDLSISEMQQLAELINDHLNHVNINNYYDRLPTTFKSIIIQRVGRGLTNKQLMNSLARDIVDELSMEYALSDPSADLDKAIEEIKIAGKELQEDLGKLSGGIHVSMVTKNIETMKKQKEKLIADGKTELAEQLQVKVIDPMEETITLSKFKEFCKKVKIKKYDLERPDKVFRSFNTKYFTHKKNINDINSCPKVLAEHIKDHVEDNGIYKVCIAFCKYCMNFTPDDAIQHNFMYYFIKNIHIMNLICPRGIIIENDKDISDESMKFYITFRDNIRECIENIR